MGLPLKSIQRPISILFVFYSPPNRVFHQTMEVITKLPMYGSSILWTPATSLQSGLLHSESTLFHKFGVFWCSVRLDCLTASLSRVRTKSHTRNEFTNSISLRHKNSIEAQEQWKQSQRNEYFQGTFLSTASLFPTNHASSHESGTESSQKEKKGYIRKQATIHHKGRTRFIISIPKNSRAHAAKVYGNPYRARYDRFIVLNWSKNLWVSECQKMSHVTKVWTVEV